MMQRHGLGQNLARRNRLDRLFKAVCLTASFSCLLVLLAMLVPLVYNGLPFVDWQFLTSFPSSRVENAGVKPAIVGTFYLMAITVLVVFPLGVATAVFIEEFLPRKSVLTKLVRTNVRNLAGVPSIVFGILGMVVFVNALGFGRSLVSGGLTLALMILPIVVITACEALRSVPKSIRLAAYAVGGTRVQTVFYHVVPCALPQILTGLILGVSRAIGEAAPLILIGGLTYVAFLPENIFDSFTALPIQIYSWASRPQVEFHHLAAGAILVLLAILVLFNSVAIYLRAKYKRRW